MKSRQLIRTTAVTLAVFAGLCLAGCGGDSDDEPEAGSTPSATTPSDTTPSATTPDDSTAGSEESPPTASGGMCDVLAIADVVDSFGVEIEKDAVGAGSADQQGTTWKYRTCSWETPDQIEVRLGIATAADFPDGVLDCPPLAYLGTPGEPVPGLDADAWWVESGFNEEEGTLRVCTETHLFDIDVDRPSGTVELDTLREQAADLATKVLPRLEG